MKRTLTNSAHTSELRSVKVLIRDYIAKCHILGVLQYKELASKSWSFVITKYSPARTLKMLKSQFGGNYQIHPADLEETAMPKIEPTPRHIRIKSRFIPCGVAAIRPRLKELSIEAKETVLRWEVWRAFGFLMNK